MSINPLKQSASDAEKELIINTLNYYHNHKGRAAKHLNVDRKTLYNKIKKYGLLEFIREKIA